MSHKSLQIYRRGFVPLELILEWWSKNILFSGFQIYLFFLQLKHKNLSIAIKWLQCPPIPQITFLGKSTARTQDDAWQHLLTVHCLPLLLNSLFPLFSTNSRKGYHQWRLISRTKAYFQLLILIKILILKMPLSCVFNLKWPHTQMEPFFVLIYMNCLQSMTSASFK